MPKREWVTGCWLLLLALPAGSAGAEPTTTRLEHITVTARGRAEADREQSILYGPLEPRSAHVPATVLAELLQAVPGLAYAGQGGLLQTVSIRGISGQRVANFYGDLPIQSERRAGTSSSFIDPLMLDTVQVVRGPASVYYGSGALAGVLQFQPARPAGTEARLQWGSEGDENLQYLGHGDRDFAVAVSRRAADASEAANGTPLNTGFEQYNAQLSSDFTLAGKALQFSTLYSHAEDIGKSNSRYPQERVTDYPREHHWLAQLRGELGESLNGSVFYHQQLLETRVERPAENVEEVESTARDWGLHLDYATRGTALPLRMGLDYFGRRNVRSKERLSADGQASPPYQQTLDADQDGLDLYLDSAAGVGQLELAGGLRWSLLSQRTSGFSSRRDTAPSAFARATWFTTPALELSLEVASGVRFPSLSERYFSGATARGEVIGNPGLDEERTLSTDLGLRWHSTRAELGLHVYAMQIDDYIERLDIAADTRSFANLGEGDIVGAELAGRWRLNDSLTLRAAGHYQEGEDESGTPLADIAAPRLSTGIEFTRGSWRAAADFQYRFEESRVAPSEQPVDSAALLSASLGKTWARGWSVSIWGRNLLDETWLLSADSIAPLGPRRTLGISLAWRRR